MKVLIPLKGWVNLFLNPCFFWTKKNTQENCSFSELRRSWELRFLSVAGLGIYFGNLIWILGNLTWISEIWPILASQSIFSIKIWKFREISREIQLKSMKFLHLWIDFWYFSECKLFWNDSYAFCCVRSIKTLLDYCKISTKIQFCAKP